MDTVVYLRIRIIVLFECISRLSGVQIFQNLSCVTYDWDEYMTCEWSILPEYSNGHFTTLLEWKIPMFPQLQRHNLSSNSYTWHFGGYNGDDVDPHQTIIICLQLQNKTNILLTDRVCETIDIQQSVKPSPVIDLYVSNKSPDCLIIHWSHNKVNEDKIYLLRIYSDREEFFQEIKSLHDDINVEKYSEICNLSYFTNYTIAVEVQALDEDGSRIGYVSDNTSIFILTQKNVPSYPPHIFPGSFMLSALNAEGYRGVTLYWQALPRRHWNGESLYYEIEAVPVSPCKSRSITVSRKNVYAVIDILYTCSYNVSIRAKNEIGMSVESSTLYLSNQAWQKPRQVFMIPTSEKEMVEIKWKAPLDVEEFPISTYTLFWCKKNSRNSCKGPLHNKTIAAEKLRVEYSSLIMLDGFPDELYIYGVSAERNMDTYIVSSGLTWTDCCFLYNDIPHSPKVLFKDILSEGRVIVKWIFTPCEALVINHYNNAENQVKICTSELCNDYTLEVVPGKQTSISFNTLEIGPEVCVSITVKLNEKAGKPSQIQCYATDTKDNTSMIRSLLIILLTLAAFGIVFILALFFYIWWNRKDAFSLPEMHNPQTEETCPLANSHSSASGEQSQLKLKDTCSGV